MELLRWSEKVFDNVSLIPPGKLLVSESGIRSAEDVRHMAEMGCDAVLVGETFCKLPQSERGEKVREFVKAGRVRG